MKLRHEFDRVGEIAIMAEGEIDTRSEPNAWLRINPGATPGRGVPGVADSEIAAKATDLATVEHIGNQTDILDDRDPRPVADSQASGFLPAVLQRVKPVCDQRRY